MKQESSTQLSINEGDFPFYFQSKDFYNNNSFQNELTAMRKVLQQQFNQGKDINELKQLKQIFKQVSAFRFQSFKLGLLSLIACLEGKNLFNDVISIDQQKLTNSTKQQIAKALQKFVCSQQANPVTDINKNMQKIIQNKKLFNNQFFGGLSIQIAKHFFTKYFITKVPKLPNIQRLAVKQVQQREQNSLIVSLKSQQMEYSQKKQRRYCYAYLFTMGATNKDGNFWILTAVSKQPSISNQILNMSSLQQKGYSNKAPNKQQMRQFVNKNNEVIFQKTNQQISSQNKQKKIQIYESDNKKQNDSNTFIKQRKQQICDKIYTIFILIFIFVGLILNFGNLAQQCRQMIHFQL